MVKLVLNYLLVDKCLNLLFSNIEGNFKQYNCNELTFFRRCVDTIESFSRGCGFLTVNNNVFNAYTKVNNFINDLEFRGKITNRKLQTIRRHRCYLEKNVEILEKHLKENK